ILTSRLALAREYNNQALRASSRGGDRFAQDFPDDESVSDKVARSLLFVLELEFPWLTCFAHRSPQLLQRSRFPLGPRLHSGVVFTWQFAQSCCKWPTPFLRFLFFLFPMRPASS